MSRKKREDIEPNLTSLIDLVFLLLIFFIVSSVFRTENNKLVLNLPESSSGETIKKENENLFLEVHENKVFFKDREFVDLSELEEAIQKENNESLIELKGDKTASYGRIIEIFDILQRNNFSSINLITIKKENNDD